MTATANCDRPAVPLPRARGQSGNHTRTNQNHMNTETLGPIISMRDATEAFAVPGESNIIDCIHPITGLSFIYGESLEKIQIRYPGAERVNIEAWSKAKADKQDAPVEWLPTTEQEYDDMLNCLPPAAQFHWGFLVGEAWDHHATSGRPRYAAYIQRGDKYFKSDRPMTVKEFKATP